MTTRIVLVGAGHAHLHVLKHARDLVAHGAEVVVVAPEDFWYSGMATGMLAALVSADEDRVDVSALASGAGAVVHRAAMTGINLTARIVHLDNGDQLPFDLLSLNLGSVPPHLPGDGTPVFAVKPIKSLVGLRTQIERDWAATADRRLRVAIVGAGVTAVEVAANLSALAAFHRRSLDITIYGRSRPLRNLQSGAASALIRHLRRRRIALKWPTTVNSVAVNGIVIDSGNVDPCDYVVNASGLIPAPIAARLGLPVDESGALIVDEFLRSTGDAKIYAVGDCIAFNGCELPRVGVYAVRQAPVLLANLIAKLLGKPPTRFTPQKHYLGIIALGRSTALMFRAGFWLKGFPALCLKRWIDRRFVSQYRPQADEDGTN